MKLKQEFVLRQVAGEYVLIPIMKKNDSFSGVITLNETGVFIWKLLENGASREEILAALLEEYDVTQEHAEKNLDDFCANLQKLDIL